MISLRQDVRFFVISVINIVLVIVAAIIVFLAFVKLHDEVGIRNFVVWKCPHSNKSGELIFSGGFVPVDRSLLHFMLSCAALSPGMKICRIE